MSLASIKRKLKIGEQKRIHKKIGNNWNKKKYSETSAAHLNIHSRNKMKVQTNSSKESFKFSFGYLYTRKLEKFIFWSCAKIANKRKIRSTRFMVMVQVFLGGSAFYDQDYWKSLAMEFYSYFSFSKFVLLSRGSTKPTK